MSLFKYDCALVQTTRYYSYKRIYQSTPFIDLNELNMSKYKISIKGTGSIDYAAIKLGGKVGRSILRTITVTNFITICYPRVNYQYDC